MDCTTVLRCIVSPLQAVGFSKASGNKNPEPVRRLASVFRCRTRDWQVMGLLSAIFPAMLAFAPEAIEAQTAQYSYAIATLGGGFQEPSGVAVDSSGNVYIADYGNSTVKKMPAGCGSSACVTTLGGGFANPVGVTVSASGTVYVADSGNNAVKEMPGSCTSSNCVASVGGGFKAPYGVALDASGNV